MTYAPPHRALYDADSHIMELPDFLRDYADPAIRERIPQVSYAASLVTDEEVEEIVGNGKRHAPEHVEGGKDPIGRFEGSLGERPAETRDNFYAENFLRIFPEARAH